MRRTFRPLLAFTVGAAAIAAISAASGQIGRGAQALGAGDDGKSHLGSYLAGRFARGSNDTAAAVGYYRQTLTRDPANDVLAEQAFLMELTEGNFEEAKQLSLRLSKAQEGHRLAHLFLGLSAFKSGSLDAADAALKASASGPIGELTGALSRAWVKFAQGKVDEALDLLQSPSQPEWAQYYMRYHRALIADAAGRRNEARAAYERVFKTDARTLRIALAFARHAANTGDMKLARSILKDHIDRSGGEGHPMARALRDELEDGVVISLILTKPEEGLAEVFYGLGEALSTEGGTSVGAVYLQMSLYMQPGFPFALAALANVHETNKRYEQAIATYERIPAGTPLQSAIDIRKAVNLNLLDRVDEAKQMLEALASRDPSDIRPLDALGSIMRARKRYEEAVDHYTRAIALIPKPERKHWSYWYSRGTSYERLKQWPKAEADLKKALQLHPDQPLVLNYLGYSWIDQNINLKQGLQLIEKAVSLKPDDGYIVDSLGWAHYRMSNYKDAVRYLERAVELRPEDPVLNDHLGDALWRVGREREARYQWDQALTLNPEPDDAEKIKAKLQTGLAPIKIARPPAKKKEASKPETSKKRVESKGEPQSIFPIQ